MADEKLESKRIMYTASMVGALVTLLIVIIASRTIFPSIMFESIVVALMVLIIIVNGYGIFGEQIKASFRNIKKTRNETALSKKYFKRFSKFVDKLEELIEPRQCDNIPHTLSVIQSSESVFGDILFLSVDDFRDLFVVLRNVITELPRNRETFLLFLKWFGGLLNVYNRLCVCRPIERIRNIIRQKTGKIPENIKEEYRQNKVAYDKFILEYRDFAKEINKNFGEGVAREWFEMPKGLEL